VRTGRMTGASGFRLFWCLCSYENDLVSGKQTLSIEHVAYLENRQS
jgi:hypothetical protein